MENLNIFEMLYDEYKISTEKPLRLIEFFAGYGSQALALKYLGVKFEHHKICEWAINSIIAYASLHRNELEEYGNNFCGDLSKEQIASELYSMGVSIDYNQPATFDQLKRMNEDKLRLCFNSIMWSNNLVDISRVKGADLHIEKDDEYLLTYSFPCGLAGTKIITKNGYKNIEDVTNIDYVLTHKNRFKKVVKTMKRISNHYYELKGLGVPKLFLTEEHPLYIFRDGKEQWIKVKDLKETDMFSFNVNQKNIDVDLSSETLWLLGRYVADGWINEALYNSVEFAIAFKKEKEFLENIPKKFKEKFKRNTKSCYEYRIADKNFQNYCKQFGSGAKNKTIPQWVIDLPKEKLQCFFNGYISGDGHIRFRKKVKQIMFSTVSEKLFLGMQQIVAKLYGCICSCYIRKDNRKETFNDSYNCQFNDINNHRDQIINNDKIYTKIKKIIKYNKEVEVYNFEVEEDNSYTCQNVIVHNCQDLSLAGKGAGMEKGSGTRSGLLWEVERILSECENKPQILLMENVPQIHSVINIEHFKQWILRLEEMGYQSYWEDMSAVDFGIPQTRNRTFMISIYGNYNYKFPKTMPLKLRLKDLLESNVDEKYYLSDSQIEDVKHWNAYEKPLEKMEQIDKNEISPTLTTRTGAYAAGMILIKNKTKKGYLEATEGDGIDISSRMESHRGTVQKDKAQTITTMGGENIGVVVKDETTKINLKRGYSCEIKQESKDDINDVDVIGNYSKSNYNQTSIVGKNGLAPTVTENHGQVTEIIVSKDE